MAIRNIIVVPVLKAPDWPDHGTVLSRPLFTGVEAGGRVSTQVPWVSFVRFRGNTAEPVETCDLTNSLEAIEAEALANIRTWARVWKRSEFEVSGRKIPMLTCVFPGQAAEKILDRDFMLEAAATLGVTSLCVAIPKTESIMAIALDNPLEALARFAGVAARAHAGAEFSALTPALFTVTDGRLSAMVDWIPEDVREDQELPQVRGFILTSEETGRKTQGLTVMADRMTALESALQQALSQVIEQKLWTPEYEPMVLIGVVRAFMPNLTEDKLARLKARLVRFMKTHPIQSPTGRPYEIDLTLED
jgi:hypothetical protein